jgi:hypothetical protein
MEQSAALSSYRSRLTTEEIDRVRSLTADVAARVLPAAAASEAGATTG